MNISKHLPFIPLETLSAFAVVIVVFWPSLRHSLHIHRPTLSFPKVLLRLQVTFTSSPLLQSLLRLHSEHNHYSELFQFCQIEV